MHWCADESLILRYAIGFSFVGVITGLWREWCKVWREMTYTQRQNTVWFLVWVFTVWWLG